ncbi:latexin isoform X5 [Gadus chalcogrammus]|uniref:latexin isoform X5 n=1 Tax=Gadus chalcogrammus TaxID=1042646 RepID=UPI0024C49903|nr:latexin isoform X5 [Gadus chalcogrammus]
MSPALMRVLWVVVLLSAVRGAPLGTVTLPPVIPEPVPLEPVAPEPPQPAAAEPVPLEPVTPEPVAAEPVRVDSGADQNISTPINTEQQQVSLDVDVMLTGELNPNHYPARRAAQVVLHHLNTRYGSPYWWGALRQVHKATAEALGDSGRKYSLEVTLQDQISGTKETCTAEVVFPGGPAGGPPQVTTSYEGKSEINTQAQEEALYNQYNTSQNLLSGHNLPDSQGHVAPGMEPFWHLGGVASSFVMLKESSENTLYNMAQVVSVTQLATENNQLRFNYDVLLHEMVSQEIIHWKLLASWSPQQGVKASQMELLPKCHHCEPPQEH